MKTKIVLATTLTFSTLVTLAQSSPPPGSGAPIDGGVIILLLGIIVYSYWKMKRDHKKTQAQIELIETFIKKQGEN